MKDYELIKFKNDQLELDVKVSPEEDTVWLALDEMALLFGRDKSVINRHINNIFKENELSKETTIAKNATMLHGREYVNYLYNLDVIISVGYRVKSQNGIAFRRWANAILKDYLLKGYVLNEKRSIITNENYLSLLKQVTYLQNDVTEIKTIINRMTIDELIFFENKPYSSFAFINALLKKANDSIVIIDSYLDDDFLTYFVNVNCDIKILLVTNKLSRINEAIMEKFKKEFKQSQFVESKVFHDRFVIIDDDVYSLGCSLNSLGNKISIVVKLNDLRKENILKLIKR